MTEKPKVKRNSYIDFKRKIKGKHQNRNICFIVFEIQIYRNNIIFPKYIHQLKEWTRVSSSYQIHYDRKVWFQHLLYVCSLLHHVFKYIIFCHQSHCHVVIKCQQTMLWLGSSISLNRLVPIWLFILFIYWHLCYHFMFCLVF